MTDFKNDPTKDRLTIRFSIHSKVKFIQGMNELGMTANQFIMFLIDSYYGDSLKVLRNHRYAIKKRLKKGVDRNYLKELQKTQKMLNTILKYL